MRNKFRAARTKSGCRRHTQPYLHVAQKNDMAQPKDYSIQGGLDVARRPGLRPGHPVAFITKLALAVFLLSFSAAAAETSWSSDLTATLKTASAESRPILVLIRNTLDAGTIDARTWLQEDQKPLEAVLAKFHTVMLWSGDKALKELPYVPQAGLIVLSPKSELLAIEEIPFVRSELKPLLERLAAVTQPIPEAEIEGLKKKDDTARFEKQLKGLPDDLKTQIKELIRSIKPAASDRKALARAKELCNTILAREMSRDECLRAAGHLGRVIFELDLAEERVKLAEKIKKEAPIGRIAADAFLDLAEDSFVRGNKDSADRYLKQAEKASERGESPTFYKTAMAMRALIDGKTGPRHSRWAKREVLDVVVLVPDMPSYLQAIARWDEETFFPVLFEDDLYAPKFIAAFKPAQVVRHKASVNGAVEKDHILGAISASWQNRDDEKHGDPAWLPRGTLMPPIHGSYDPHARGIVVADANSGELPGGIALAAGRFQPLVLMAPPKNGENVQKTNAQLSKNLAWDFTKSITAALKEWGALDENAGWSFVTLAGEYPFRYSGDPDGYGYGTTYALDDLIGRDEDGIRHSVVGRLIGDNARSTYQAMCSLFLQPESAFLFNTYGLDPKTIWGVYRMDFSESAWKEKLAITHYKGDGAKIETFREKVFPWNRDGLITINSSGGAHDWSVSGGGGTGDDFPVGVPCAIHVTHSGSAGNPYDNDTLAGRALWGGAFFYFGSAAEPFLSAFQAPSYYAPFIAQGAPFAAAFRKRTGQWFSQPWRLMIAGDPQFCLREKPATRKEFIAGPNHEIVLQKGATHAAETPQKTAEWVAKLRRARLRNDVHGALDAAMKLANDATLHAELDGPGLAVALEELDKAVALDVALQLWEKAPADARKHYAARIYARQAAGALLDKALASEDLKAICSHFERLLATGPAGNYTERWLTKLGGVAEKKKEEEAFSTWLTARTTDEKAAPFRSSFVKRLCALRLKTLGAKEKWNAEDKAEALKTLTDAIAAKLGRDDLIKQFEEYSKCCTKKFPGATEELVVTEVRAFAPPDSDNGKRIAEMFKEIEKRKAPKK